MLDLTVRQFIAMLGEVSRIVKLEVGGGYSAQPRMLTGEAAHRSAMRMFGGKKGP